MCSSKKLVLLTLAAVVTTLVVPTGASPVSGNQRQVKGSTWEDLDPIPFEPRQEHKAMALNATTIALVGGIVPSKGLSNGNTTLSVWKTTNMFQLYNTETRTWSLGPPMPFAVNNPNAFVYGDQIFLFGGLVEDGNGNWVATGETWTFDIPRNNWRRGNGGDVPAGMERGGAAIAEYNGVAWFAGGLRKQTPRGSESVDHVMAYQLGSDKWAEEPNPWVSTYTIPWLPKISRRMPAPRDHACAAIVGSVFYVVGGREGAADEVRDTVFALDLHHVERGWKTMPGRMPTARGGIACVAMGSKIYTLGGEGNPARGDTQGVFPDVEVYDVGTGRWETLDGMPVPRHGFSAVTVGSGIYLPGGGIWQGGSAVDHFDVFWPTGLGKEGVVECDQ